MADTITGRCLCGAVRFAAPNASRDVHVCHCGMCRRWTGGPEFALDGGPGIAWQGAENIRTYRSSDWGERAFCAVCGTALFFRIVESGETYLNAGVADDDGGFRMAGQIYVDEKPGWYDFANETEMKTGPEIEAEFRAAQAARAEEGKP